MKEEVKEEVKKKKTTKKGEEKKTTTKIKTAVTTTKTTAKAPKNGAVKLEKTTAKAPKNGAVKLEKKSSVKKDGTKKETPKKTTSKTKKEVAKKETKATKKVEPKKATTRKSTAKKEKTVVETKNSILPSVEAMAYIEEHAEEIRKVNEEYARVDEEEKAKTIDQNVRNQIYNNRLPQQVIIDRTELINEVAEVLHNAWVEEEIRAFYDRARVAKGNISLGIQNISQELENVIMGACFKIGKKRNDVDINKQLLDENREKFVEGLDNYEVFRTLVGNNSDYVVTVKKYAKRNIPNNEKQIDYKHSTGEENILRPFSELSELSKRTNIAAATDAFNAYKELVEAGISLEDIKNNETNRTLMLKAMNVSAMKADPEYRIKFADLTQDEKEKDLFAFDVLTKVVENNRSYTLYPVVDVEVPDYDQIETDIIEGKVVEPVKPAPKTAYDVEKMIEAMEKGVDVLGEGTEEKTKQSVMGYAGVWLVAISTAVLTTGIFVLGAFYLK